MADLEPTLRRDLNVGTAWLLPPSRSVAIFSAGSFASRGMRISDSNTSGSGSVIANSPCNSS